MKLGQLVAKNIKARRKKLGLSQQNLSDRTHLTVRYISRLENTAPNITLDVFERLAHGLECSPQDIMSSDKNIMHLRKEVLQLQEVIENLQRLLQSMRKN